MDRQAAKEFMMLGKKVALPTFDLHSVEEALKVNHLLYNGTPLTVTEIQRGIAEYRQFLADHKARGMPERFEVPSYLVDRVWHTHMCETAQYAENCQEYFGQFFHHRAGICNSGGDPNGIPPVVLIPNFHRDGMH